MIHKKTYEMLKKAGWHSKRKLDLSELNLNNSDLMFPKAIEFLEEFGDLVVMSEDGETESKISLQGIKRYVDKGKSDESHEKLAGERLVPVGETGNGHDTIFISESGKLYICAGLIGDTAMEGWNFLIMAGQVGIILTWGYLHKCKLSREIIWKAFNKFGIKGSEWLQGVGLKEYNPDVLTKIIVLSDNILDFNEEIVKFLDEYPEHTELVIEEVTKKGDEFIAILMKDGIKALIEAK